MDDTEQFLKKLNRRTRFTQFLVWIALFFTAVGIAAGYKNWLRIHEKAKAGLSGVTEIKKIIPELATKEALKSLERKVNKQLENNTEHLDQALKELRQVQDSTQYIADTVNNQVAALTQQQHQSLTGTPMPQVNTDWQLMEVKFLLETANQLLTLKHDKQAAQQALKSADELLLVMGSTDLLPVRKQISQDIAVLSQYQLPDFDILSTRINELESMLKPAVAKQATNKERGTLKNDSETKNITTANSANESLVSRVKKTLNDAVIVRKFDKSLIDEMDAEKQKSLYQLLSLRLETLRLLLLQGHDKRYHEQIARIKKTLKKYYTGEKYNKLEKQLKSLDDVKLDPIIPDISTSLTLLESKLSRLNKGE